MGNETSVQEAQDAAPIENKIEAKWTHVPLQGAIEPREGHVAVADENKLYIFGGGNTEEQYNDMYVINLEDASVKKVGTGTPPSGRTGATAQIVDGKIWIFGGLSTASRGWINDVYCFDIEENKWSFVVPTGDRPTPRDKTASCVIGKKIFIFGGFGPRKKTVEDMEDEEDEEEEDDEEEAEADKPKVPDFDWFDEVYILDTETNEWLLIPTTGTKPTPRCAVGMCALDENQIFVFGGRDAHQRKNDGYVLDIQKREWTPVTVKGRTPDPRSFHTCTRVGGGVVLFGGMSLNNSHFCDVHMLSYLGKQEEGKLAWLQPTVVGTAPSARGFHTSTQVGESIYIFGGSSGFDSELMCVTKFSNDLYKLDLSEQL